MLGGDGSIGMDVSGFVMEMPLLSLLEFRESEMPVAPSDLVAGLLAQVAMIGQGEAQPA